MATPDLLVEIATRHAIHLEGVKTRYARAFEDFLYSMEDDILARLARVDPQTITASRLERLLTAVRQTLDDGYGDYEKVWKEQIRELGAYEGQFEVKALQQLGGQTEWVLPSPAQIYTAAFVEPLSVEGPDNGKLLQAFYRDWTDRSKTKIVNAIRLGAAQGQTTQQVVQRIRGTRAAKFRDGLIEATRRETTLMARTALQHVAVQAREQTWDANSRVIKAVEWVSVLDSRTSGICRGLDGRIFPLKGKKKGPRPPIHVACRSTVVPVLKGRLSELSEGGEQFSRGEDGVRRVSADLEYYDWLKTQSAEFQDSVIGVKRGQLLRNGGLTAERFRELQLDKKFRERTLDEMRELEPLAFEQAGL